MEGRRRLTLYDQMSASDSSRDSLAGLTLDEILANQKRSAAPSQQPLIRSRTLLDIIREDESNRKDRKSWKAFKDKLRLKRAGSAWTSSIHVPASDVPVPIPIQNNRTLPQVSRRNSVRFQTHSISDVSTQYMAHQQEDIINPTPDSEAPAPATASMAQFSRRSSTRYGSTVDAQLAGNSSDNPPKLRQQMSRWDSTTVPFHAEPLRLGRVVTFRDSFDDDVPDEDTNPETGRALSAREAVAAQEASEAAAAAEAAAEEEESSGVAEDSAAEPVRMSLMDLLEETDREMGFEGSRYMMSDEEDFEDDEGEGEREGEGEGVVEYNCCVCMVRHKGAAFIPCGHTFCRMCSRELFVSRGNCPLCNNFILEILDIF